METKGTRLRNLRKAKHKTLKDVEKDLNFSYSAIAMLERDERNYTSDVLDMFSKYYNVSIDYLMCNSDSPHVTNKNNDIKLAFYNQEGIVTPEQQKMVDDFIAMIKKVDSK